MRTDPRSAQKPPGAVKSGFHPGASKRGKSAQLPGGGVGDYIGGPQPVPFPAGGPRPQAAPLPPHPHPSPAPMPARAMGGRAPAGPVAMGGGPAYQAPGIAAHELLSLLARALSPDAF